MMIMPYFHFCLRYNPVMHKSYRMLVIIFGLLFIATVGLLSYLFFFTEQDWLPDWLKGSQTSLQVEVIFPPAIQAGKEFRVVMHLDNDGTQSAQVNQVRISEGILGNTRMLTAFPEPITRIDKPGSGSLLEYEIELAPGEGVDFIFHFRGDEVGDYKGEMVVQSDGFRSTTQLQFSIMAIDPHDPPPTPTPTWKPAVEIPIPYESAVQITALETVDGELTPAWSGSGAIISNDGLILTSARVALPVKNHPIDALLISITQQPNIPSVPAYYGVLLQADPRLDMAVVVISTDLKGKPVDRAALNLSPVPLGSAESLLAGDALKIIGYPTVGQETVALVQAFVRKVPAELKMLSISATVPGGFSGGMAINSAGELVGIPTQMGFQGEDQFLDCRIIHDSNRDGEVNNLDRCVPTGGFINALRPVHLARPLIEAARRGEVNIVEADQPIEIIPEGLIVSLQDDFSNADSGWETFDREAGWGEYSNDAYRIQVKQENTILWAVLGKKYSDVVVEVKTSLISPTGTGDWGLFCRYNGADHYYWFAVTEEGFFGIFLRAEGRIVPLLDWQFSRAITRYRPITLTAACLGDKLSIGVDGKILGSVMDTTWTEGDIGLAAGTWDEAGLVVGFDDLVVRAP